jgi:hypothetical protein
VLLQNRNAFGHALIRDIAGNASDKPVPSENPKAMIEYRIKSCDEPHERVVKESELSRDL